MASSNFTNQNRTNLHTFKSTQKERGKPHNFIKYKFRTYYLFVEVRINQWKLNAKVILMFSRKKNKNPNVQSRGDNYSTIQNICCNLLT